MVVVVDVIVVSATAPWQHVYLHFLPQNSFWQPAVSVPPSARAPHSLFVDHSSHLSYELVYLEQFPSHVVDVVVVEVPVELVVVAVVVVVGEHPAIRLYKREVSTTCQTRCVTWGLSTSFSFGTLSLKSSYSCVGEQVRKISPHSLTFPIPKYTSPACGPVVN